MNSFQSILRGALGTALLVGTLPALSATAYRVEKLPQFSTDYPTAIPSAIGPNGEVVGTAYYLNSDTGGSKAILWNNAGQLSEFAPNAFESSATDINQLGQVAVTADYVANIVQNGNFSPLFPSGTTASTSGINSKGQVTGYMTANGQVHAFLAGNGGVTDLGTLTGYKTSYGVGINASGDVVGYAWDGVSTTRAVLWRNGVAIDLGTLPGYTNSTALAINDHGQIVGSATAGYPTYASRAFLWENGVMTDLGAMGVNDSTYANDINNAGQITGSAHTTGAYNTTGFIYQNGVFTNINAIVGMSGCSGLSINDAGQLAGTCSGQPVRLTPTTNLVDLGVDMTANVSYLYQGSPITFTASVVNTGTSPLTGVNLVDTLPAELSLIAATTSQGSCSGTASVACALGDLAPGATATVQIQVNTIAANYSSSNTVNVSAAETEAYTANNSAKNYVTIYPRPVIADLGVSTSALQNPVSRRSNITYNVVVKNAGPETAKAVSLTSGVLSNPVSLVSYTVSRGSCTYVFDQLRCNLGDMANGETATLTYTVKPKYSFSFLTYTNSAAVSSTTQDNNTSNNYASVTVSVK